MSYPFVPSHYPPGCSGPPAEAEAVPCAGCDQPVYINDPNDPRLARTAACDRCLQEEAADRRLAELKEG